MMNNIKILQTPDFLALPIPTECIPKRFAIATNFILCAKIGNEATGLLLFNYEPEKWNQWYPYFSSVNDMYTFEGSTYSDIVSAFEKNILTRVDVKERLKKAEMEFLKLLETEKGHLVTVNSPVKPEMWLKYSKTQDVWTFYYMEFLQITSLPKVNFEMLDHMVVDFLPLTEDVINSVITNGKYRGVDVVDNTLEIIKDKELLSGIKNNAINI